MQGNGGGQCGAGSEIYLIALEILDSKIIEKKRFLVQSCKQDIYLAGDGSDDTKAINIDLNNQIIIQWLNYPKHENTVVGIYDFSSNVLSLHDKN